MTGTADGSQQVKRLKFIGHRENHYNHDVVHWFTGMTAAGHTECVFYSTQLCVSMPLHLAHIPIH